MVIYDFCCEQEHRFEGWFRKVDDCHQQIENGLLSCPVCGDRKIRKLPTASKIKPGNGGHENAGETGGEQLADKLRDYIERNYEDVGHQFPEEARKVYYGEAEPRNIYGDANPTEVKSLLEEGISVTPIPIPLRSNKKLN